MIDESPEDRPPAASPDPLPPRAFRQRERLQSLWRETHAAKASSDYRLRRAKAELDRIRAHPAMRFAMAVRRLARRLIPSRPPVAPTPTPTPASSVASSAAPCDAARFRSTMLGRLAGGADGPFRLAVVGETAPAGVAATLRGEHINLLPARDPAADAVLLTDPAVGFQGLAPQAIRIGWLGDAPGPWLDTPSIDDLDLVLVGDEAARTEVLAGSAKSAVVVPSPLTAGGAAGLREALVGWLEAPHVAVHIGPLTWQAAASWGDLPFGRAVQKAFERRGWPSSLHVDADRDRPPATRADLAVHIFGVRAPAVRPGQPSVLWIISHPDFVTRDLCLPYDLIGVASVPFLEDLRAWLGREAPRLIPLLQATDPERFFPEPGGPAHEVLFVGSSRKVRRPILDHLAATSRDLAVYGRGWTEDLLDPRHLRGEWVPNDVLRRHYASAAIVLSDAYADMRDEGFIANRVFDALASGGFVISEPVAALDATFDGGVATYDDGANLVELVEHFLAHPHERRRLAEVGRGAVLARHTFDHRIGTILEAVGPLVERARS